MFRFSLLVCVSLILGITAKPYKPGNKLTDAAFQDTVMSMDDKGKMSWGVEVEPPEDLDETDYDIDPRMKIWKSMAGRERPLQAEEDLDELHHLLKDQIPNQDVLPVADMSYDEPEEDRDDIDHPVFREVASQEAEQVESKAGVWTHVAHSEPEEDKDDLYHRDDQRWLVHMEPLRLDVMGGRQVRLHLQPEEDMDDLYHKDHQQPALYQDAAESDAPVDLPYQRKHSEPEEDLDDLYHM
ncbi:uncharacterized protein si:ch211-217g15.3 [Hippoglossus stenolepis]|uniref:uncharacterized protein si:ch211-217g15.3 n=1 Tax=Hippoglossus stenolepis TaxID=195615 RepID=UPI00159CB51D|nr:uncharacterized protein si:ch211-217g15.3 [Hippoglossus stenolepis]